MTGISSAGELQRWLSDYLVAHAGCEAGEIDLDASFADLGVGSRDAVVLSGELAELLERAVSPVDFWQHPTIKSLAEYLTNPESDVPLTTEDPGVRPATDEPIAVIGMGCRFPGGIHGPESLWQFLCEGRSAVGEVPPDRWKHFDDGSPEAAAALSETTRWGSFLADIDAFDAEFFEISPREAAKVDPQQRLLLEVAYEALEHAGLRADALRRTQTGVFAGACAGEYGYLASTELSRVDAWSGTGGALSIIANRVSYFLDLRGPSVTVDTACSSALVAVHLACRSLHSGECNLAIAAGVNVLLSPVITRSFDHAHAMSATGQCHVFDAAADGFVRGEGCGVVVLKRLTDALRDGDPVLAVVRGSAVNQDGRSNGLMAPNPAAQMAVLRAAYSDAGASPGEVDYVEAHATGSLLGDPIEARALGTVLGSARSHNAPLLVGSVKSNLGHLDAAAGIASFIKVVLAIQRAHIPANLNFHSPNPHIAFEELCLKVIDKPIDWPSTGRPRAAGVSSFGFGGTNAHVVLGQGPDPAPAAIPPAPAEAVTTLVVRGKTDERVAATARMLAQWMDGAGAAVALADVAHTLNHHRARHAKFATVAALDREQAVAGLRALASGRSAEGVVAPHQGACRPGTVFVYSGHGSQWAGMGRRLLNDEPAFAAAVDDLDSIFPETVGFSLREILAAGEPLDGSDRREPVLVGMQLALTELWRSYGVRPDAVIGHSTGQVAACVVAGALSVADGLRVIATCSRLRERPSGRGATAPLDMAAAGAEELRTALANLSPRPPTIPVITTPGSAPISDPAHWAADWDEPARFGQAVAVAGNDYGTFIEISPHPLLTNTIRNTLGEVHHHSVGTLHSDTHDTLAFHSNLNATHTTQPPDTAHPAGPHPVIPNTPWHHTRHWMDAPIVNTSVWHAAPHLTAVTKRLETAVSAPRSGSLLGEHVEITTTPPVHLWQAWLKPDARPYPGFHRVGRAEVVPFSLLLHTLSTAATEAKAAALSDIRFEHPITVEQPRVIQVVADGESIVVASATDTPAHGWTRHATARISRPSHRPNDTADSDGREYKPVSVESMSSLRRSSGVEGRPFEWSIDNCRLAAHALHAKIEVPEASTVALLDAALNIPLLMDSSDCRPMVPAAAGSFQFVHGSADSHGAVDVLRRGGAAGELIVDIVITAPNGSTCVDIRSLRYEPMVSPSGESPLHDETPTVSWSEVPAEHLSGELEVRFQAILARELGMVASAVGIDRPFPELGLDSMMAMAILKDAKRLVGFDLSATMLWNHPTISSLSEYLAETLAAQRVRQHESEEDIVGVTTDPEGSVLDALFDSAESATADSESGI
jgi:phthiocerol/phenolphthiocerol synthesis type-I polyketide synthase A